jgi:hypothetical protein
MRDTHATGTGSIMGAGTAGYCVGNLLLDGARLPGEDAAFVYPDNLAPPQQVRARACAALVVRARVFVRVRCVCVCVCTLSECRSRRARSKARVQPLGAQVGATAHAAAHPTRTARQHTHWHAQILIDASNGASDYGNKFGEPLIAGYTRTFGQRLPSGERREWLKPIMFRCVCVCVWVGWWVGAWVRVCRRVCARCGCVPSAGVVECASCGCVEVWVVA